MGYEPFDVQPVIAQLVAQVPKLLTVGGAADYAAVKSLNDFRPPCAFVLLAREKAQPHSGQSTQRVQVTFGVAVAVRNFRVSDRGTAAAADLNTQLAAIRGALIGWTPESIAPDRRGIQFIQGDLTSYDAGTLLWTDVYQTFHFLSGNSP